MMKFIEIGVIIALGVCVIWALNLMQASLDAGRLRVELSVLRVHRHVLESSSIDERHVALVYLGNYRRHFSSPSVLSALSLMAGRLDSIPPVSRAADERYCQEVATSLAAALGLVGRDSPSPRRAIHVAVTIAGRRRVHLRDEWAAVLAGDPGNGLVLTSRQRFFLVAGFLIAALRFRLRDAVHPLWLPVDWLLSAQARTETFIAVAVGAQVIYIALHDGLHDLLTYGWGWCGGCGGALYLLSRWLRRVRGIELAAVRGNSAEE